MKTPRPPRIAPPPERQGASFLLVSLSPCLPVWASAFPRGPGLYFHLGKLAAVLAVYLCWVRTCWWVAQDCKEAKQPAGLWGPVLFGAGALGLAAVWVLPLFWVSFVALAALYLGPTLLYVARRNEAVAPEERVLTPRHLRALADRLLGRRPKEGPAEEEVIPIRFIGKSAGARDEDARRVARAEQSAHYRAALDLVHGALLKRATDIHLEPTKDEMTVRLRVDGILYPEPPFPRAEGDALVNIFKVLADLDITEKRKPQDGSFSAEARGTGEGARQVDFRVATAGSVVGEKLVMRILDQARQVASLTHLGMRDRMREQVRAVVTQPHGMLVVCGPTGAGKSTTLYACLAEIDRFQKNVITVENPVEYHIDNVTQIEINPKAGKTFASELRSILRQDPDVIYVGEVRDKETAEIACQSAQTGHMVFTTLHANDTITALGRLLDLGVPPFMVASSVSAVLGQRLVRVLCPRCKVKYKPNPEVLRKANLPADKIRYFYRPPREGEKGGGDDGCPACGGTGYRGRTGVFELLPVTDAVRALVRDNPNLEAIRQEAVKHGMVYLQQDGMRQVIEGVTSVEELLRVAK